MMTVAVAPGSARRLRAGLPAVAGGDPVLDAVADVLLTSV
jgi:hypothetical protein